MTAGEPLERTSARDFRMMLLHAAIGLTCLLVSLDLVWPGLEMPGFQRFRMLALLVPAGVLNALMAWDRHWQWRVGRWEEQARQRGGPGPW